MSESSTIKLGDKDYPIARLNFGVARKIWPAIEAVDKTMSSGKPLLRSPITGRVEYTDSGLIVIGADGTKHPVVVGDDYVITAKDGVALQGGDILAVGAPNITIPDQELYTNICTVLAAHIKSADESSDMSPTRVAQVLDEKPTNESFPQMITALLSCRRVTIPSQAASKKA